MWPSAAAKDSRREPCLWAIRLPLSSSWAVRMRSAEFWSVVGRGRVVLACFAERGTFRLAMRSEIVFW